MVNILEMTLEVISWPFNIELLKLCHFVSFLYLLDMFHLIQILLKTDICICNLLKRFDTIFPVTLRSLQGHLS